MKLLEGQLAAGAVSPAEVTRERIALDTTRLAEQDAKRLRGESRVAVAEAIGIPVGALEGVEISFAGLDRVPPGLDTPAARRQALVGRAGTPLSRPLSPSDGARGVVSRTGFPG